MKCLIRANNIALSRDNRKAIAGRIKTVLSRMQDKVSKVIVSFQDINGTRGGVDKLCHIKIIGNNSAVINVKEARTEFYPAFDAALSRAQYSFVKRAKKLVAHTRQKPVLLLDS